MFKNRKWIGTVLLTLLAIIILAAAAGGIYRIGYAKGARASQGGEPVGGLRFGLKGFDHPDAGRVGGGFGLRGHGSEPDRVGPSQGHEQGFVPRGGNHEFGRGGPWLLLPRLLFSAALVGLLIFVVMKMFRPGGWQLSFGPLHPEKSGEDEEDKPVEKTKKSGTKKGK